MKHTFLHIFLFLLMGVGLLHAQNFSVKAKIDSTQLWIGNQTALRFEILQNEKDKVKMPLFSDTIVSALEIVQNAKQDTVKLGNGRIRVNVNYVVTSFHDSLVYVPSYPFVSGKDTSWSNSTSLRVIQPFKIDTASHQIADIKPVFKPKFNWSEFLKKTLLILLLIGLAIVLFFVVRKFVLKKPMSLLPQKEQSKIPAHIEALAKLDKIKNEKLWQQGRFKEYHTELTDALRVYIERVFEVNGMEMTSKEILDKMQVLCVDKPAAFEGLNQILRLADLVKFAKWSPEINENELSLLNAYLFVNQTKVEEIKPPEQVIEEEKPES